ncbi:MAG TPA: class I SAM-dependent methyltransferase [Azospirillaceae bacterium]|nr:class I SAM-dependent methyltransferase [Azospirillaceae bacterium]
MTGSKEMVGPPPWTDVGTHGVFPEGRHDEVARFNFLASLNVHIQTRIFPGNRLAYEKRVRPRFHAEKKREPQTRQELRPFMEADPYWQTWSALRRTYMEMRQENGRSMVLRQADKLIEKAKALNEGDPNLELNPELEVPRYLTGVDIHCMPGSYHTEALPDDVTAAANYDCGIFATTGGLLGRYNDGGGRAMLAWIRKNMPDFKPRRILDMGCGLGHNTVPLAKAFPDAEVYALDVAAPMLRYGHARAKSMGVTNIRFIQENCEKTRFEDGFFDLVVTAQFWHETSRKAMPLLMKEIHRVLAPGGVHLSLEQPPYRDMPVYDQLIRDWDAHYNNEPFWTTLHDMNMVDELVKAGFRREDCFETTFVGQMEEDFARDAGMDGGKDFGRGGSWYGVGSRKPAA